MALKKQDILMYKGRPLVRSGNTIYYGDLTEPYVAVLQVTDSDTFQNIQLPSRISTQILATDESLPLLERIKKNSEKKTLYEAIRIASIWLERILESGEVGDEE